MPTPELFQFKVSHFNEKARWALDFKGIAHVRHSLLPGPQKPKMQRLSGQEQTPVLRCGDDVVAGRRSCPMLLGGVEMIRGLFGKTFDLESLSAILMDNC